MFNKLVLQTSRCSFDVHVMEILSTLINNSTIVMLIKNGILDTKYLINTIIKNNISVIPLVPSLLQTISNYIILNNIKLNCITNFMLVGEALTVIHIKYCKIISHISTIINYYGPAETTIYSLSYEYNEQYNYDNYIPIGKPLSNYKCFVLDSTKGLDLVPIGEIGELYIGGKGLMKGYINDENQTNNVLKYNKQFDMILYKTGDLVKILPSGNILYIGRKDFQIKLRDQRLEV